MKLSPSKITCLWALFVLSSAFYARWCFNTAARWLGFPDTLLVWGVLGVFSLALVWQLRHTPAWATLKTLLVLGVGLSGAAAMQISIERMHLVKYGVMGFLYTRDLMARNPDKKRFQILAVCTLLCSMVAALDETIQYFIPNRVGDIRDVGLGALGALWGTMMATLIN